MLNLIKKFADALATSMVEHGSPESIGRHYDNMVRSGMSQAEAHRHTCVKFDL
jgi:hypothetical protein